MASLDEAHAKYVGKTPEAAAEKKRLAKQRKKAAQKARKKEKKETALAAEQSAQWALDNKKAEEEDEYGEYGDNEYEKSKKKEPLIKKYLTEEDIKNAEDAKLLQKQRTLLLNLGELDNLENMTDEQIDDLAANIAHEAHSHQASWGGRKRKRTKKRRKSRKKTRKRKRKSKTRRKRKTSRKSRVKRRRR